MSTLSNRYPVLHSGFVALSEAGLTKPKSNPPSFAETILFRQGNREYEPYFYSEDVTSLFDEWRSNPAVLKDFDFRERIIRQAVQRFGPDVGDWMDFQAQKPGFSSTHKQFLQRMVKWTQPLPYQAGEYVDIIQWLGLLAPGQGNQVSFTYGDTCASLGGDFDARVTTKALRNWLSREDGYASLLNFMYVVFGERTNHKQSQG